MSLQFQNDCGDSVKQAIIEELQNLLSSDTGVLQQTEKRIKQLEYTEGDLAGSWIGVAWARFTCSPILTISFHHVVKR